MRTKSKEDKQILQTLNNASEGQAIELLNKVRQQGSVSLLPDLIDLMAHTQYDSIHDAIQKILNDVKRTEAVPVIMQAIQNPEYKKERKYLIGACWQNGLNYSDYIGDFVDITINEPFELAFEAFTVVENQDAYYEAALVAEHVDKLKTALLKADEQKKMVLKFMIDYLEHHKQ